MFVTVLTVREGHVEQGSRASTGVSICNWFALRMCCLVTSITVIYLAQTEALRCCLFTPQVLLWYHYNVRSIFSSL